MTNKKIYLAGGMTGLDADEYEGWRLQIKEVLESLNLPVFCCNPAQHFSIDKFDSGLCTQKEAMIYDLYKVRKSDLVVVNYNAPHSLGTMAEIAIAYDRQIPIIGISANKNELHPWQIEFCQTIVTSVEDAIAYVVDHFLYDD